MTDFIGWKNNYKFPLDIFKSNTNMKSLFLSKPNQKSLSFYTELVSAQYVLFYIILLNCDPFWSNFKWVIYNSIK